MLVGSSRSVSNNYGRFSAFTHFSLTNAWKEFELIVKNHSEEFGLFNTRDEFWIWISTAKSAEMHTHCFAAREFEAISVSPV